MSKSKGEFLTVSLLESKGYDPLSYRFFCLQSHYRNTLVFSYENLDNAQQAYKKLISRVAALSEQPGAVDEAVFAALKQKFCDALNNDLNTSLAITALYDVLKADTNDATKRALIADFDQVLGLDLLKKALEKNQQEQAPAEDAEQIEALIAARAQAKREKNWAEADRIRDELKAMGIQLTDTPQGVKWSRV